MRKNALKDTGRQVKHIKMYNETRGLVNTTVMCIPTSTR